LFIEFVCPRLNFLLLISMLIFFLPIKPNIFRWPAIVPVLHVAFDIAISVNQCVGSFCMCRCYSHSNEILNDHGRGASASVTHSSNAISARILLECCNECDEDARS